jgi:uncharacterized protein (TIRG00374 family)
MPFSYRAHLNVFLGLVISALAVYLSFRKIDFPTLWESLRSVHFGFLALAPLIQMLCFVLKGSAWRYLLRPAKRDIRLISPVSVLVIGLMVNDLFPAKMGELARAYFMGKREGLPKSLCFSTVMVEHLLDVLILTLFLLILLPLVSLPPWLRISGLLIGLAGVGAIVVLFFLMRREEKFLGWMTKILRILPERFRAKIQLILANAIQGFRAVTGRNVLYALGWLFAMWCTSFLLAHVVLHACRLDLPFQAAVMVVIYVAFGKLIPSSPASIGTYHYIMILVLTSFNVSKEAALSAAILLHAFAFLNEVTLGMIALLAGHLSLAGFARRAEEAP